MATEYSPSEAARRIGATTRSVQRWIAAGRLPARRVGSRWRVASDALDAFVVEPPSPRPIRTVFVANRGEIAVRIARTCRSLGIEAVIPETEGPAALDLLDAAAVIEAARAAGADAIHPGFGFLAENADFAEAVVAAGIRWIGPPAAAIRAVGDKAAARRLAVRLGVPVIPGFDGDDQSDEALESAAGSIGLPILVKPAAGGGGKGMRVVRSPGQLRDAFAAARRESMAAFGDDRLVLERFLEGPRHVEVQVLFDGQGNGVDLGERDCSLQRRHQKILEETPSPGVDPATRTRLAAAALELAGAVGYVSAGTVEFLLDDRAQFYLLEMNTRLQVEHPVTELVTGRDLVADQLRIAAGDTLGFRPRDVRQEGHAIEARLYAEDAEDGFLPSTGRIEALRWPSGEGIRVDAGVAEGDVVGGRFDPMLAKVIVHGRDREEALERLTRALDETLVLGLVTNLRFLRWLVRQAVVRDGQARIDTLDRIWPPDDWAGRARPPDDAWTTAASAIVGQVPGVAAAESDPWTGGWRVNAEPRLTLVAEDGTRRSVAVARSRDEVALEWRASDGIVHVDVAGRSVAFRLAPPPDVDAALRSAAAHEAGVTGDVAAPMPGTVVRVHVEPGAGVAAGEPLVTLEAMKMEHVVVAPGPARVGDVLVAAGDQVARGHLLVTLAG